MSQHNSYRNTLLRALTFAASIAITGGALAAGDYGAIAFSPSTQGHGYTYGFATGEAAGQAALNECEKYSRSGDCISVVTLESGCAALAVGTGAYGSAAAADLNTAGAAAIHNCQSAGGKDCKVLRWLCR